MAPNKQLILEVGLDILLERGFNIMNIEDIEWVSSIAIILQKGGKGRIYVNYQALNKVTCKDNLPIPFIDEVLDNVAYIAFVMVIWIITKS